MTVVARPLMRTCDLRVDPSRIRHRRAGYVGRGYLAGMPIGRAVKFAVAICRIVAAAWSRGGKL
jgi:hypothetical protein